MLFFMAEKRVGSEYSCSYRVLHPIGEPPRGLKPVFSTVSLGQCMSMECGESQHSLCQLSIDQTENTENPRSELLCMNE